MNISCPLLEILDIHSHIFGIVRLINLRIMKMKKYMLAFALCAHTLYGCSSEIDSSLIVYSFDSSSASLGDGTGDLKHPIRLIRVLPKGLPS